MTSAQLAALIDLALLGAALLMLLPVCIYLFTGWKIRRDKLLSYLSTDALVVYYGQFPWTLSEDANLQVRFRKQFHYLYGRRHFLVPLLLLFAATATATFGLALTVKARFKVAAANYALPDIAVSALLGAFAWAILDELSRIRRRDLAPADVYAWVFRILVTVPFGFAFAAVMKDAVGVPVAFFLGAFPTQILFTFGRRIAAQRLGMDPGADAALELMSLQSIDRNNAERFQDEGINTIATLAWADPIDLTIRTNFDFNYVLDCMSQALLWVYFENKIKQLYQFSLRGAQEVNTVLGKLDGVTLPVAEGTILTRDQQTALATLQTAAAMVNMTDKAFFTTLDEVRADPYTQFIVKVWH
jgi:hypothetical protein